MIKDQITNEGLKKKFKNNFDLANFVIATARYFVQAGHEVNLDELLRDIQKDPNRFKPEELAAMDAADREETGYPS